MKQKWKKSKMKASILDQIDLWLLSDLTSLKQGTKLRSFKGKILKRASQNWPVIKRVTMNTFVLIDDLKRRSFEVMREGGVKVTPKCALFKPRFYFTFSNSI